MPGGGARTRHRPGGRPRAHIAPDDDAGAVQRGQPRGRDAPVTRAAVVGAVHPRPRGRDGGDGGATAARASRTIEHATRAGRAPRPPPEPEPGTARWASTRGPHAASGGENRGQKTKGISVVACAHAHANAHPGARAGPTRGPNRPRGASHAAGRTKHGPGHARSVADAQGLVRTARGASRHLLPRSPGPEPGPKAETGSGARRAPRRPDPGRPCRPGRDRSPGPRAARRTRDGPRGRATGPPPPGPGDDRRATRTRTPHRPPYRPATRAIHRGQTAENARPHARVLRGCIQPYQRFISCKCRRFAWYMVQVPVQGTPYHPPIPGTG